jgi:hypothetical protein
MYRLKNGAILPHSFKIKVTPEQNEAVQKYLFSQRYSWQYHGRVVNNPDSPYLFTYADKRITHAMDGNEVHFQSHKNKEIKFEDYFFPEKWVIEITKYNRDMAVAWINNNSQTGCRNYTLVYHTYLVYPAIGTFDLSHLSDTIPYGYKLITTEQFMNEYLPTPETKSAEGTKALTAESVNPLDVQVASIYHEDKVKGMYMIKLDADSIVPNNYTYEIYLKGKLVGVAPKSCIVTITDHGMTEIQ